jgi:hypothetical protein
MHLPKEKQKPTEHKFANKKIRLFENVQTVASDDNFFQVIKDYDSEFRDILKASHFLNEAHSNETKLPNSYDAFVQQSRNDLNSVMIVEIAQEQGETYIPKERHWQVAQHLFQRYSFNGSLYQALNEVKMSDPTRLKLTLAIDSLLKNIDIYFKEKHFYEFYERCRATFEPDPTETEDNSVSEVYSTK